MRTAHKLFACILTSFIALAVAASAQPQSVPAGTAPAHIRIAVAYAPKTLNAALATDAAAARLLQLTHPALMGWNAAYQPTGKAALSCSQTAPAQVTCLLPQGFTFTDGAPFTAAAVKQWLGMLQKNPRSPFYGPLTNVAVTASGQTLVFTLPKPTLTFLATLTEIPIANPAGLAAGLGPYKLAGQDTLGNTTLVTARTDIPQKLEFLYVQDATTRLLKLKKGEVDMALGDLAPEQFQWAKSQGFATVATPGTSYTYLGLNFQNEYLAQPAVREAIALALNRPAIRKHLLGGLAAPAASLLPAAHPAAWLAPEEPFDPFSAEGLLDEATLLPSPGGPRLTLQLLTSTDGFIQRLSQVIQQQLAAVGIAVELRPTEWASFYDAVKKGQFDMVLLTWTGEQQPAFYHMLFHSTQVPPTGFNRGRFKNDEVDALTTQIITAPTLEAQYQLAIAVQKKLAGLKPYIPLYSRHHVLAAKPTLTGCTIPPSGNYLGLLSCRGK